MNEDLQKRYESHFAKLFGEIDKIKCQINKEVFGAIQDIRNTYVRAPAFITTAIVIIGLMAGTAGFLWSNDMEQQKMLMDQAYKLGVEKGKREAFEKNFIEDKNKTIAQLIDKIKKQEKL